MGTSTPSATSSALPASAGCPRPSWPSSPIPASPRSPGSGRSAASPPTQLDARRTARRPRSGSARSQAAHLHLRVRRRFAARSPPAVRLTPTSPSVPDRSCDRPPIGKDGGMDNPPDELVDDAGAPPDMVWRGVGIGAGMLGAVVARQAIHRCGEGRAARQGRGDAVDGTRRRRCSGRRVCPRSEPWPPSGPAAARRRSDSAGRAQAAQGRNSRRWLLPRRQRRQ